MVKQKTIYRDIFQIDEGYRSTVCASETMAPLDKMLAADFLDLHRRRGPTPRFVLQIENPSVYPFLWLYLYTLLL